MKIGIVCAMIEEQDSIISALNLQVKKIAGKFEVSSTQLNNHQLFFILCGIGKVNAAIHTQYLIDTYQIESIINVGVAGSLSHDLTFGDVVIANDLVQHDMDVTSFGLPLGQIPRMDTFSFVASEKLVSITQAIESADHKTVVGRIVSGDQFIDNKDRAEFISREFNALACEMEGAAIAHVCHINNVPFLVVRALSDMAGRTDTAIHSFDELKDMSAKRSAMVVKKLLEQI